MKRFKIVFLLLLAGVVVLGIRLGGGLRGTPEPAAHTTPSPTPTPASIENPVATPALESKLLEELIISFSTEPPEDPEIARTMLENIRREALALPPERASQLIREFLKSGADASTGLEFLPGEGGTLREAPTLKVFLLDLLEQVDPAAAAELATTILRNPANADEWAIALRTRQNVLPDSLPENLALLRQALQNPAWIAAPTQGLLHALDLAAMAGDFPTVLRLAELAESEESGAWAEGVAVTMHRMAREFPEATLRQLNAHPDFLAEQPLARADLVAYANLRDPSERLLVEQRLANPRIPLPEKQKILHMLAAPGEFVHEGLFTPAPQEPDARFEQERFSILLDTLLEWREQFPDLQPSIREVAEYLMVE